MALENVKQAVVISKMDKLGEQKLIAYLVCTAHPAPSVSSLRHSLSQKLPDYMIPSAFVFLDFLPLNPNGKVDRKRLPEPGINRPELDTPLVAPRDELEFRLTSIWERLLDIHPIGIRDNFFHLGGHSLMAVNLFNQIRNLTDHNLPLSTLLQAPTVEQLANILHDKKYSVSWSSLVPIQTGGRKIPFFCVHAHGGNVLIYRDLARHLGPDQPFYGLQARGLNGEPLGRRRIEDMATDYLEEIRHVQSEGPYFLGGYCMGGTLAFEMAQQLLASGEKVGLLAMIQSIHPNHQKILSEDTAFHRLVYQIMRRIDLEVNTLLEVKPNARLPYIASRIRRVANVSLKKGIRMISPFLSRSGPLAEHSIEDTLEALGETHLEANKAYKPSNYPGKATLLRASKQSWGIRPDPTLGWGQLVEGGLEVLELPGYWLGLLEEPRVEIVAEELKFCLDKAREEANKESLFSKTGMS
jgi:thioesterase domain-containing protein